MCQSGDELSRQLSTFVWHDNLNNLTFSLRFFVLDLEHDYHVVISSGGYFKG